MAFASLFTLLDDIASVLDDVALMTKLAARKTAGVVGDDLALNANQVTGVRSERELPIIWAVAKGSLINKAILIPIALILAVFSPMLINPLLMIGGAYLCFEGVEKLLHKFLHKKDEIQIETSTLPKNGEDEADKIKGAIRTDFILSAEIIILALGVVQDAQLMTKVLSLAAIGVGMTIFVYGVVALIVKADDFGAYLLTKKQLIVKAVGQGLLRAMPMFMRFLSVVGTIAMFLVGGGIFNHNIHTLHEWLHARHWDMGLMEMVANFVVGVAVGTVACVIILPIMNVITKNRQKMS
ncbi:DUF808 domain-containing protein [Simonsiella muelleri]|uniref:Inner membrane protein yedI n=1 Tax=Simonsiella muelleri ATCC 29453 TaxID=641147 RepID=V9HKG9_9NEIS|nr:DUF808 domain-containing protein [Simonsiella muelleri]AUX61770.1 hypothetical protein BWP33_08140 [Simonsiella muelleri ATCC 29453]EFG30446.1 hypothetical protein HMPREF9021_01733 [Simonsiella muelleri ATCC 29453]UBQ53851.1 DUF808 domain-containing protein [Simonsiella muelleri]